MNCSIPGCTKAARKRGWCYMHYTRWQRHGDPEHLDRPWTSPPAERFALYTEPATDGCLLWTGALDTHGYGQLKVDGRNVLAHRFAWTQARGPIPPGQHLRHDCDTPRCVNVNHLRLGDNAANVRDKVRRGRQPQGTRVGRARLSEADVLAIRARCSAGERAKDLAVEYGVARNTISVIVNRVTWRHL